MPESCEENTSRYPANPPVNPERVDPVKPRPPRQKKSSLPTPLPNYFSLQPDENPVDPLMEGGGDHVLGGTRERRPLCCRNPKHVVE